MVYKSLCKACDHAHDGMRCNHMQHKTGTIRLRSYNSQLFGVDGGYVKRYDNYNGGEPNVSFKPFDIGREEAFEYSQESDCGCRYYVPSDNLEFVEWKYEQSQQ